MKVYIYGLVDPRNPDLIRYVGKTKTPLTRHIQHCSDLGSTVKALWIDEIRQLGIMPQMVMIEEVTEPESAAREAYWIDEYRKSGKLTNSVGQWTAAVLRAKRVESTDGPTTLQSVVEGIERAMIIAAIKDCSGHMSKVAKKLAISRPTLYEKIKKLKIETKDIEDPTVETAKT